MPTILHKAICTSYIQRNAIKILHKKNYSLFWPQSHLVHNIKNGDTFHECHVYSTDTISRGR